MTLLQSLKRSPVVHLWLLIVFFTSGLVMNCLQILILLIWPVNKSLYRWLISKVSYLYLAEVTFVSDWWANVDVTFYGKKEDYEKIGTESAMLMPNHRSDIDWLVGYMIADRNGILGTAKCYMKNDVKYIPTIGWTWWFLEFCFLRRSWDKDQSTIQKSLKALSEYPIPFLVGIFAESTRMTPEKLKASQEYAESKGIKPLKHHLLPRPKGFSVTVIALKDSVPAIYDIEVAFEDPEKANLKTLIGGGLIKTHLYLRRIEMKDVPTESIDTASQWCKELFVHKDSIYDEYVAKGRFPGDVVDLPKHYWNLYITLAWNVVIAFPVAFAVKYLIASFSYVLFIGLGAVVFVGYVMTKLLFYHADTKRGSSFGLKGKRNGESADIKKNE